MSLTLVAVHDEDQRSAIESHLAIHRIPSYIPDDYAYHAVAHVIDHFALRAAIVDRCYVEAIHLTTLQVAVVVFPHSPIETLVAQVQAGLAPHTTTTVTTEHFTLDMGAFTYHNHTHRTRGLLTRQEHQLLRVLLAAKSFVSTKALFAHAWPAGDCVGSIAETVSHVVRKLRQKLEADWHNPQYLVSQRGLGYRLCLCPDEQWQGVEEKGTFLCQ